MGSPVFNKDLCIGCGTCVSECDLIHIVHTGCGNIPQLKNTQLCIGCGHCISVCPNNAITHPDIEMGNCVNIGEIASPSNLAELIKARRSARQFKIKSIDKSIISNIIDMAACAPSDLNSQNRYFYILTDNDKIAKLESLVVNGFKQYVESMLAMEKSELLPELQLSIDIIENYKNGKCPIFRNSPCIIFVFGPKQSESHFAPFNAITANAYLMLYAQSLGIESCVIGRVLYNIKALAQFLEISSEYEIYSALALGYSKNKYRKTISRKPKIVNWN